MGSHDLVMAKVPEKAPWGDGAETRRRQLDSTLRGGGKKLRGIACQKNTPNVAK